MGRRMLGTRQEVREKKWRWERWRRGGREVEGYGKWYVRRGRDKEEREG